MGLDSPVYSALQQCLGFCDCCNSLTASIHYQLIVQFVWIVATVAYACTYVVS